MALIAGVLLGAQPARAALTPPGATVSFEFPAAAPPLLKPTPMPTAKPAAEPTAKPIAKPLARPNVVKTAPAATKVDERPLWALLREKRLTELKRMLATLRRTHPRWKPPHQLLALLQDEETRQAIRQAIRKGDPLAVVSWAERAPRFFDANHMANRWAWLDALKTLERQSDLRALLDTTMTLRMSDAERLATLQKAHAWVGPEAQAALIAREQSAAMQSGTSQRRRDDLALLQLDAALQGEDDQAALRLAQPLEAEILRRRDARRALSLGWLSFRLGDLSRARTWFECALEWNPQEIEAREGLALTHLGLGEGAEAERIAKAIPATDARRNRLLSSILAGQGAKAYQNADLLGALDLLNRAEALAPLPADAAALHGWTYLGLKRLAQAEKRALAMPSDSPKRLELLAAVRTAQANEAYAAGKYDRARSYVEEAERANPGSREARVLKAWIRFQKGEFEDAALDFAELYDATLDLKAAEGLVVTSQKAGRQDLLETRREDPILSRILGESRGREAFALRHYPRAYAEAPGLFPDLAGVHLPSLTAGISRRSRAGAPGMSDFQVTRSPVAEVRMPLGPANLLRVEVDHLILDNGTLATGSVAGSMPTATPSFRAGYFSTVATGYQPRIRFSHSGAVDVQSSFSLTPEHRTGLERLVGEISLRSRDGAGGVTFGLYSREVAESRLSWVGMEDPYQVGNWGRVRRHGFTLGRDFSLSQWLHTGGAINYALLQGEGVAENDHTAGAWSLRRKWEHPAVGELAGTIEAMGETYRRNLSAFTRGHGGYFSPQLHGKLRFGVEARTHDLRPFVVSLRLGAGPSYALVNHAPYFPFAPDGRSHEGYERVGLDYDGELRAATRIIDALHAGVSFSTYRNAGYAESHATVFTRVLFGPRRNLNSDDLND